MVIGVVLVVVAVIATALAYQAVQDDESSPSNSRPTANGAPAESPETKVRSPATLDTAARSVQVSGTVRELTSVHLQGIDGFSVTGEVTDASGQSLGNGRLASEASEITATGESISLGGSEFSARLKPSGAAQTSGFGLSFTAHGGRLVVNASGMTFEPYDDAGPAGPVSGPLTLSGGDLRVDYDGESASWVDVPEGPITVATSSISWAGGGTIEFDGQTYSDEFLGVTGSGTVTLTRTGSAVAVTGESSVVQIWADGLAQIGTEGFVEIKRTPAAIPAGEGDFFTWAPTNRGAYTMVMSRISPGNDEGAWVELALDPLPTMSGGEERAPKGGDTTGLIFDEGGFFDNPTQPIDSVIPVGTGDERNISVHPPAGTPPGEYTVVLIVEGNFDPITVEVPVTVV